jgi:putative molybdopterin biosynthesis protein
MFCPSKTIYILSGEDMANPKRNVYLQKKTLTEAKKILFDAFAPAGRLGVEVVDVPDAVGRVLARPVVAKVSSPNFHSAAMDGYAVQAKDTFGASETRPKALSLGSQALPVNTGHVLPAGMDAVIMIENVHPLDDGERIEIEAPTFPWQNVRKLGEDIVATELLFPRHHQITPYCVGALLSGGVYDVPVYSKPKVLILPTGSELVDYRTTKPESLRPGEVLETNSFVLGKLVESCGGTFTRQEMVMDDPAAIQEAVEEALKGDYCMVLTIGGSSAGSEDYAKPVITALGEVLVHGVTIMPGKPVIIGRVADKPIFGIPGYPVSAIIAFEQFVRPLLFAMLGQPDLERPELPVQPTRKVASKLGVEEFLRVKLGEVGERIVATPLPRGAGIITSITEADGIIRIPNAVEGFKDDDAVKAEILKPRGAIRNTVVIVGSHDNSLDVIADELKAGGSGLSLSSSHVGSMGGLMAVKRGLCHLAGSHLLNTEDGSYNTAYIQRLLPEKKVRLVNLVLRDQGFIVPKGNPLGIQGIEDLSRPEITFINRQGGAGTRILLDYRLDQVGLSPEKIKGYHNEEFTHMSVAVAVLSGAADMGLGIYAAAKALELDFIPVVTEQYDLVIPDEFFETDKIQTLLAIIATAEFKERVMALGGYSTERTGEVIF